MVKKNKISSSVKVKQLLLEMGGLLVDYGHTWSKEMRSVFNKAISYLEKEGTIIS